PNVSVRPAGTETLGVPVELKNLNSFRAVERALDYEIRRQAEVLSGGGEVRRETRRWDEAAGVTRLMRVKETAEDYRYFPEPDLLPLVLEPGWVESVRKGLPELRTARRERFVREYGLPRYDAGVLTASRHLADYFEEAARLADDPKKVSNWLMGDVSRLLNESGNDASFLRWKDSPFPPSSLAELISLVEDGTISGKMAKDVLEEAFRTGKTPRAIVDEKGLSQISDAAELEAVVAKVLEANPSVVEDFRQGKEKALGYLVGQVMKETRGKANPRLVNELLRKRIGQG
ncbi:MAG TPA: Asp-tRNA(Asn)/Glu-tRNA(Gln) amidotransferase GatCAB subunit B, partial [Clostridiales bacterium]|nr:Asp-tRNA(Asn)/Glu-tRNA(Gln) amidotransferase GatCAB subunit B [Clostridiales bacterium]